MAYALFTLPACHRLLKKLPQNIQDHLFVQFEQLQDDPLKHPQLKGKLRFLRSLHTRYKNTDYRAAYEVDEKHKLIILWYAASRENFYRQLEKLL